MRRRDEANSSGAMVIRSQARLLGAAIAFAVYLCAGVSIPAQGRSFAPHSAGAGVRAPQPPTVALEANPGPQSDSHTIASGTWKALAHQPPVAVTNCLLLTDATVMCQQLFSNAWYRLTPDNTGSYIN